MVRRARDAGSLVARRGSLRVGFPRSASTSTGLLDFAPGFRLQDRPAGLRAYNVRMKRFRFAWSERKNRDNVQKHGVSFEEARTAFLDENAKVYFDPDHSEGEDRFLLLGMSSLLRVLVVCHCCREGGDLIRIISARKANRREQRDYWS